MSYDVTSFTKALQLITADLQLYDVDIFIH